MAMSTYSELKDSIAAWTNRDDLTAIIPDFILLTEKRIDKKLRDLKMENRATTDTVASQENYALPSDFISLGSIKLNTSTPRTLVHMAHQELELQYDISTTGTPESYSIAGGEFVLAPTPDGVYEIEINYYQTISALSDTNTSNWFLVDHPDLYLAGGLAFAFSYLKDDVKSGKYLSLFEVGLEEVSKIAKVNKHAGNAMYIRTD